MWICSRRKKPRPGRLDADGMARLRAQVFERDNATCKRCGRRVFYAVLQERDDSFHLAHRRNKRMWGDTLENTQCECGSCHRTYHRNGPSMEKPVPKKVRD